MVVLSGLVSLPDQYTHTWQEVLEPGEMLGGPSKWGNSRYSAFRLCAYWYYWTYVKRMTPVLYNENLEIGGLYHEARARYGLVYLQNIDAKGNLLISQKDVDDLCRQAGFEILSRAEHLVPGIAGVARKLFNAWLMLYGPGTGQDRRADLYDVETLLEVESPFPYSCRLDEWGWDSKHSGMAIYEIKTTARRDFDLINSYRFEPQFLGQQYLWRRCMVSDYGDLDAHYVDLVTKGLSTGVHVEQIPFSPALDTQWEELTRATYKRIIACEMDNSWPQEPHYYRCRKCPLFEHCASGKQDCTGWREKVNNEY